MILQDIINNKKKEVEALKKTIKMPVDLSSAPQVRDLRKVLEGKQVSLIAEIKAASPSAGIIMRDYDPARIALMYEKAGVKAISVLTDAMYFKGSIEHLNAVRKAVKVPVLRKDFILDGSQIYEARLAGADAVLLIVRILGPQELKSLIKLTNNLGMTPLVEVHTSMEAQNALDAGADVIGINNRDLDTLRVDINTTSKIINLLPEIRNKLIVSESGIRTRQDVSMLKEQGVNALLVGESILRSGDIPAKIEELTS